MRVKTRVHIASGPDGPAVSTCDGDPIGTITRDPAVGRPMRLEDAGDGVHYLLEDGDGNTDGPAQVATESYRAGWERTFNGPPN